MNKHTEVNKTSTITKTSSQQSIEAINEYKRLAFKLHITIVPQITSLLKNENLKLILNTLNLKESSLLSKVISKFYFHRQISFSIKDVNKESKINKVKSVKLITETDKKEDEKKKKQNISEAKQKQEMMIIGVSNNIRSSFELRVLCIYDTVITEQQASYLSKAIRANQSIINLIFNKCYYSSNVFDIVLESLLEHPKIEVLDLSENRLTDKNSNIIARIITRQSQLRDQVVWMYGLRNEKPQNDEYAKGLTFINLSNNQFNSNSCITLANALSYDNYIRKIDLKNNLIEKEGISAFNKLLKTNITLINVDLRDNIGFDENNKAKINLKLANNIIFITKMEDNINKEIKEELIKYIDFDYFDVEIPHESKYIT